MFKKLTQYRRTNNNESLEEYKETRNDFRKLCKEKKCSYGLEMRNKLQTSSEKPKEFWSLIKSLTRKPKKSPDISGEQWYDYFNELLKRKVDVKETEMQFVSNFIAEHDIFCNECTENKPDILNSSFTEDEVRLCISNLPNGKAGGIDGILNEMLKCTNDIITPLLTLLFNKILLTGEYPNIWCKAIICPIFKSGNPHQPSNYRGISLLCTLSKVFTKIINSRLVKWADENEKRQEEQAGYRKGYSTIDQIFNLQSIVQKYLCKKKGRCYVIFVDFSKAFDTIPHCLLWFKLINNGIHGDTLRFLRNMYMHLQSCVCTGEGLTKCFTCKIGVRQGCMLSPFLFILYLNELIDMLKANGCQGIYLDERTQNVMILLYADDMAMCSDTVGRIQKMIDVLGQFCEKWAMIVNLTKTKIVVFRRGGCLKQNEKWYYNGGKIEVVSSYKYLGIFFTSTLKWSQAKRSLAAQARKAIFLIKQAQYKCGFLPFSTAMNLFDKMITPILLYGSEIWGYEYSHVIEQVQLEYCKKILGVRGNTINCAALGECGRRPLAVHYMSKCVKYWLKLIQMPVNRYPHVCYNMLRSYDDSGKISWATHVKMLLYKYGFGHVWLSQGVGDEIMFLKNFKQRLSDCFAQDWHHDITASHKLNYYANFKYTLEPERYLHILQVRKHLIAFAKLRCASHNLAIEKGRHDNIPKEERLCTFCDFNVLEDEFHAVMICEKYEEIRCFYIPQCYLNPPSIHNFNKLMSTQDDNTIFQLSIFIYKLFELRKN